MHHLTELSFIDEFRWVSPFHYAVLLRCVLQAGRPPLPYYCAIALNSCIILPPVSHSPNHKYNSCQLTRQLSCVSNFYSTFKVFIWLYLVNPSMQRCLTRFFTGDLLLELCILLIDAWKTNKCNNYSFSLLIMYGISHMFWHYIAILRKRSECRVSDAPLGRRREKRARRLAM
jgi:hypothetical protein